jgi:hypothetical protein
MNWREREVMRASSPVWDARAVVRPVIYGIYAPRTHEKASARSALVIGDARGTRPGLRELWQARNPYRLDQAAAQFSNTNPGMSEKSAVLLVTRTNPVLIACAAIIRSKSRPLVQPHCAMILP